MTITQVWVLGKAVAQPSAKPGFRDILQIRVRNTALVTMSKQALITREIASRSVTLGDETGTEGITPHGGFGILLVVGPSCVQAGFNVGMLSLQRSLECWDVDAATEFVRYPLSQSGHLTLSR